MWPFRKKPKTTGLTPGWEPEWYLREAARQAEIKRVEAQLTKTWKEILLARPELASEEDTIFNMAYYTDGDLYAAVRKYDDTKAQRWEGQVLDLREPYHGIYRVFGMDVFIDPWLPPGVAVISDGMFHLRPERFKMDTLYRWRMAWLLKNRPEIHKFPYIGMDPVPEDERQLRAEFERVCKDLTSPVADSVWKEYYVPVLEKRRKEKSMGMGKVQKQLEELQTAIAEERRKHADELLEAQLQAQDWKNQFDGQAREVATQRDQIDTLRIRVHQLECEKDTEACCTGEMRDSYQREIEQLKKQLNTQAQTIWSYDEQLRIEKGRAFNRGAEWQKRQSEPAPKLCFPTEYGFEVPDEYLTTLENAQREVRSVRAAFSLANKNLVKKEATITSLKTRLREAVKQNDNQYKIITWYARYSGISPTRAAENADL